MTARYLANWYGHLDMMDRGIALQRVILSNAVAKLSADEHKEFVNFTREWHEYQEIREKPSGEPATAQSDAKLEGES